MLENQVYIAAIASSMPQSYSAIEVCNAIYPESLVGRKAARLAQLLTRKIDVPSRSWVIDPGLLPVKKVSDQKFEPKQWGMDLIQGLMDSSAITDIGFITVAYNTSSSSEILPNLAAQISQGLALNLDAMPEVLPFYGCAAGVQAIASAYQYCRQNQRAAVVFAFEHCSWLLDPITDVDDPLFLENLKANLLFNDGAVAIIMTPGQMLSDQLKPTALRIVDVAMGYTPGDAIGMKKGHFLVGDKVAEVMPKMVSDRIIRPLLEKHQLTPEDIQQWSIHQGGLTVLSRFLSENVLGLSEEQIEPSKDLFKKYGNFSCPSCLFVLDEHFAKGAKGRGEGKAQQIGMVVGFGAGYYYGAVMYDTAGVVAV